MKFVIDYMLFDDSGKTVKLNYDTLWADNVKYIKYKTPPCSYIRVRAKNYDEALEKAKIKLSKIATKKNVNKYIINGIKETKPNANYYVIGKMYVIQKFEINWKYGGNLK